MPSWAILRTYPRRGRGPSTSTLCANATSIAFTRPGGLQDRFTRSPCARHGSSDEQTLASLARRGERQATALAEIPPQQPQSVITVMIRNDNDANDDNNDNRPDRGRYAPLLSEWDCARQKPFAVFVPHYTHSCTTRRSQPPAQHSTAPHNHESKRTLATLPQASLRASQ